jgi:anti-sigma regulatory factor (Ser/Thr protein kinase)
VHDVTPPSSGSAGLASRATPARSQRPSQAPTSSALGFRIGICRVRALALSRRGQEHEHEQSTNQSGMSVMIDQLSADPRRLPVSSMHPESSCEARNIVRDHLSALRPSATPEAVDNVLLVVSELVTNAYRHAGGLSCFRVSGSAGNIHVQVADPSPVLPYSRSNGMDEDLERCGGFGWPLVLHLAREVTVRREPEGGTTIEVVVR